MRGYLLSMLAVVTLSATSPAWGQAGFEMVKKGKQATGMIEVNNATGSAFCINAEGLFLTSAHVVSTVESKATVKLILQGGETDEKTLNAKVVRLDKERDLALLRVTGVKNLPFLELGSDKDLIETMEVTAFGYPFGREGVPKAVRPENPSVSVNKGRITTMPKVAGKIAKIVLDVTLNPGNSGGPVIDSTGKVIGVVQGGLRGAGINFAVPVSVVTEFLSTPVTEFEPPAIAYKDRSSATDFTVLISSIIPITPEPKVEISIQGVEGTKPRVFEAKSQSGGRYVASVIPIPPTASGPARLIDMTADFEGGQIRGQLKDREVKVAGQSLKLGDLSLIERIPVPQVTKSDGSKIDGELTGLTDAMVTLGNVEVPLDLRKASRISLQTNQTEPDSLACTVVVTSGGKELARLERSLNLTDSPKKASGGTASLSTATFSGSKVVRKLPGRVTDVVAGGDGRYLFLTLRDVKKLAVLDLSSANVERMIPLGADDALVAAGSEKLIIIFPDTKIIQTYKIGTFARLESKALTGEGTIRSIAMGSHSQGPILYSKANVGPNVNFQNTVIGFIDADTLKPIQDYRLDGNRNYNNVQQNLAKGEFTPSDISGNMVGVFRASANGSTFGAWRPSTGPTGLISIVLQGKSVRYNYQHNSNAHVAPGPDGHVLYTGTGGLFSDELKPVQTGLNAQDFYLPSSDPNYFIGFGNLPNAYGQNFVPPNQQKPAVTQPTCKVYVTGSTTPLFEIGETEEINFQNRLNPQIKVDLPLDRRIYFNPTLKAFVTIPESTDEVMIRRVDVLDSLKKSNVDYLFVTSIPPRTAFRRQNLSYRIAVESRQGGITYSLSDGPKGMKVSDQGVLTWDVPADFDDEDPTVVILIKNSSGQEAFHTFPLRVR